jgi:acetylornithine deacetylase/succinyl-diaminopimelate desuccinylase-like protein
MSTAGRLVTAEPAAQAEVGALLSELIRINTSNPTHPERPAAEWVAGKLDEVGIRCQLIDAAPGRTSVVARIEGRDPRRPALLVHGHLDVVPADPEEWSVHPFSGDVTDGYVWGRGAVDMKNMDAMVLAIVRDWARNGKRPDRDLVLAFVADEESGGSAGSRFLAERHRELFADCTEAIGEVGGFSVTLNERARLYLIQTAEKGLDWLRIRAKSRPGHGSMLHDSNAVTRLAAAVSRIGEHQFPIAVTDTAAALLDTVAEITGVRWEASDPEACMAALGSFARMLGASLRNTATPTMLEAGYKANVVPSTAEATIDARFLPGEEDALLSEIDRLMGPHVERDLLLRGDAVHTSFTGALVDAMADSLRAEDPLAHAVPYLLSGGTDAKAFATLGVRCFGFAPLMLPADLDFTALFHGIDERVPVSGLKFGVRVLERLLATG